MLQKLFSFHTWYAAVVPAEHHEVTVVWGSSGGRAEERLRSLCWRHLVASDLNRGIVRLAGLLGCEKRRRVVLVRSGNKYQTHKMIPALYKITDHALLEETLEEQWNITSNNVTYFSLWNFLTFLVFLDSQDHLTSVTGFYSRAPHGSK